MHKTSFPRFSPKERIHTQMRTVSWNIHRWLLVATIIYITPSTFLTQTCLWAQPDRTSHRAMQQRVALIPCSQISNALNSVALFLTQPFSFHPVRCARNKQHLGEIRAGDWLCFPRPSVRPSDLFTPMATRSEDDFLEANNRIARPVQ